MRMELAPLALRVASEAEKSEKANEVLTLRICTESAAVSWQGPGQPLQRQEVDLRGLDEETRARTLAHALSSVDGLRRQATTETEREIEEHVAGPLPLDSELAPKPPVAKLLPRRLDYALGLGVRMFARPGTFPVGAHFHARYQRYLFGAQTFLTSGGHEAGRVSSGITALRGGLRLASRGQTRRGGLDVLGELGVTWSVGSAVASAERRRRMAAWGAVAPAVWFAVDLSERTAAGASLTAGYARGLRTRIDGETITNTHGPFAALAFELTWHRLERGRGPTQ